LSHIHWLGFGALGRIEGCDHLKPSGDPILIILNDAGSGMCRFSLISHVLVRFLIVYNAATDTGTILIFCRGRARFDP
jgi:hypothetical protein